MKQILRNGGLVVAGFFASVSMANAALPAAVGVAFTQLQTDALELIDLAWGAAIPITIGFIILGMFRRAASSAT